MTNALEITLTGCPMNGAHLSLSTEGVAATASVRGAIVR
jgi:hypothetical protein